MTASPSELTLECKSQRYSMLLKSFGDHPAPTPLKPPSVPSTATDHHGHHPTQKLEEYLARLEDERLKIDAFKRELPLCVQLLSDAMEASKQQLQSYGASQEDTQPVLEEFIPLNHSNSVGSNQKSTTKNNYNSADKANWMTSAQLWSCQANSDHDATKNQPTTPKETNIGLSVCPNLLSLDNKQRSGGAFLPFIKESDVKSALTTQTLIPDLALASSDSRRMEDNNMCSENHGRHGDRRSRSDEISTKVMGNGIVGRNNAETQTISAATNAPATATATTTSTTQTNRKQRRCWSPELHRRFVNALQMLGGSQVATPKQIRELMQVDGLTNDEVKSHLQKYRLHTRRPIPSPQSTVPAQAQQLVVLGSIWVPPEYAAAAHGGAPTIYGAHPNPQVSPHYCTSQEFYPPHSLLSQPHPRVLHQQQLQVYRTASQQVHISHDSDEVGRDDRSGSTEDGKSESSSWKGERRGENGVGVRKKLGGIDEEMSNNGSVITLKF